MSSFITPAYFWREGLEEFFLEETWFLTSFMQKLELLEDFKCKDSISFHL